jgi:hypothetical protein
MRADTRRGSDLFGMRPTRRDVTPPSHRRADSAWRRFPADWELSRLASDGQVAYLQRKAGALP